LSLQGYTFEQSFLVIHVRSIWLLLPVYPDIDNVHEALVIIFFFSLLVLSSSHAKIKTQQKMALKETHFLQSTRKASPDPPPRRRRRPKGSSKKWKHEKRMDSEFDLVIVPSDGISLSGSDSEDSDWSVGWFEPHHSDFTHNDLEDSFAVLVPCYGSPSLDLKEGERRSTSSLPSEEPAKAMSWATVLANLSRQSSRGA
jgi:hypothetical protein